VPHSKLWLHNFDRSKGAVKQIRNNAMKYITLLFAACILVSCSKSDDGQNQSPYLPDYEFDTLNLINTNLPQYSSLTLPGNHIVVEAPYGINGFVLYHAGNNNYSAFEISDPNHSLGTCSKLSVEGLHATCGCSDGNTYEILNGLPTDGTQAEYPLKRYRVEKNGNIIRVYN